MITGDDIKNIIKAEREVFVTKDEFQSAIGELRNNYSDILSAIDGYAKKAETYFQEMAAMRNALRRHEDWIKKLAEKVGVHLE